jgi:predicted ATPase/DNA-binding CsgD family transcriptional regulator
MRAAAARRAGTTRLAASDSDTPRTLPARLDKFIGREPEMERLRQLFRQYRLITLAGPGGTGKTRLAIEFADRLPASGAGQAALVELDVLRDEGLVAQSVADTLGIREQPDEPIAETVFQALQGVHRILLLDNCEHVVDASARFVDTALRRCRGLRVLATSREPLGVTGEVVFRVDGLPLPGTEREATADELMRCDAIRLFADRAREHVQDFEITADNAADVAAVCTELDGSPLAIELAARWVPTLPVASIRNRLASRFELLTISGRTGRRRQRSLREAIQWSYALLSPPERVVFRRLSVLLGPFDLETATAVCRDADFGPERILGLVSRLQATSLLTPIAGTGRYRLLESIRLFARQRLNAAGESDAIHERLAAFLCGLAEPLIRQPVWFPLETQTRLLSLLDNLLTAMQWAQRADDDRHARLTVAVIRCWMQRGHLTEGRKLLHSALEHAICPPALRDLMLAYAGYLAAMQGDLHEAVDMLTEASTIAHSLDDPRSLIQTQYVIGCLEVAGERLESAERRFDECETLASTLNEPAAVAMVLERLAWTTLLQGDIERATALIDRAMPTFRAQPTIHGLSLAMHTAATIALARGDLDEAEGDFGDALRAAPTSSLEVPFTLDGLGMVATRRGRYEHALRLFGMAIGIRGSRLHAEPLWRRQVDSSLETVQKALDADLADRVMRQAVRVSRDEAISYALRQLGTEYHDPAGSLDGQEREIAMLVAAGHTNRVMAERLDISMRTVAYRLQRIREKLGLRSRAEIPEWVRDHLGLS